VPLLLKFDITIKFQKEVCDMADNKKYFIRLHGKEIEVSEDVYYAYYRMERQERWQEEKKQEHDVVSYDAMDNGETVGAEAIRDLEAPSMEELAIARELSERLRHIVAALPKAERELIQAIYFEDIPVSDYAKRIGLTHRGVNKQRKKILSKLKMLLDIMGSF
jgi:RNA polymerase sigma factor (sigma-70 family)